MRMCWFTSVSVIVHGLPSELVELISMLAEAFNWVVKCIFRAFSSVFCSVFFLGCLFLSCDFFKVF